MCIMHVPIVSVNSSVVLPDLTVSGHDPCRAAQHGLWSVSRCAQCLGQIQGHLEDALEN